METILLALSPLAVAVVTQGVKKIQAIKLSGYYTVVVRTAAVVLSFAGTVLASVVSGAEIDPVSIETFVQTILTFLSATGMYFFVKK